jgi:hypothetical protein
MLRFRLDTASLALTFTALFRTAFLWPMVGVNESQKVRG